MADERRSSSRTIPRELVPIPMLLVVVAAVGCASSPGCGSTPAKSPPKAPPESAPGGPADTASRSEVERADEPAPRGCCSDRNELEAAYGERVRIVGRYAIVPIHGKGPQRTVIARWPAVVLADDTEVLLESFWNHVDGHSPRERKKLVGHKVVATGVLRSEPPRQEGLQNLMVPTLSPVDGIEPAKPAR